MVTVVSQISLASYRAKLLPTMSDKTKRTVPLLMKLLLASDPVGKHAPKYDVYDSERENDGNLVLTLGFGHHLQDDFCLYFFSSVL